MTFYNVPDTCTLSIWTLDGDLVRKLHHASDPSSSEATVVRWDLITRNMQEVKTGIYIWSVESRFGADVGKLIIIKLKLLSSRLTHGTGREPAVSM